MKVTHEMLSLAAVARRLDLSAGRARRLVENGIFQPDLIVGKVSLFKPARLEILRSIARASIPEIRAVQGRIINASGLPHRFSPTKQPTNQP